MSLSCCSLSHRTWHIPRLLGYVEKHMHVDGLWVCARSQLRAETDSTRHSRIRTRSCVHVSLLSSRLTDRVQTR